jgi:hypothetical protein
MYCSLRPLQNRLFSLFPSRRQSSEGIDHRIGPCHANKEVEAKLTHLFQGCILPEIDVVRVAVSCICVKLENRQQESI